MQMSPLHQQSLLNEQFIAEALAERSRFALEAYSILAFGRWTGYKKVLPEDENGLPEAISIPLALMGAIPP